MWGQKKEEAFRAVAGLCTEVWRKEMQGSVRLGTPGACDCGKGLAGAEAAWSGVSLWAKEGFWWFLHGGWDECGCKIPAQQLDAPPCSILGYHGLLDSSRQNFYPS